MSEQPRIAARACICREGRILLARHRGPAGDWYVMPGGGQQRGETLEECLAREVHEELGVAIDIRGMLYVREIIADRHDAPALPTGFHQVEIFFDCSLCDGSEPELGSQPDPEQIGHEWVELARLTEIVFYPAGMSERIGDPGLHGRYLGELS